MPGAARARRAAHLSDWQATAAPAEIAASDAPFIETEDVGSCAVCGESSFEEQAVGFDYELITCRNPWRFVRCGVCGNVWLNPRPAIPTLPVIYPPTYYAYNYPDISPIARRGKEALDSLKFRSILRALPRPARSYLDVGCGDGRFLRLMEGRGVPRDAAYGIELDEATSDTLREAGYPAYCTRVEDCDAIDDGSIDLATMFHVIEHVDDPAEVVRRIAGWLAPGGVLALETPNTDSFDRRLFNDTWWGGYHFPRHWNLFTPESMQRMLRDAGLEPTSVHYQTGHSFWMYSLHHRLRYGARPRRRLARFFDPFGGVPALICFTAMDKLRAALGARTSAMLVLARKPATEP